MSAGIARRGLRLSLFLAIVGAYAAADLATAGESAASPTQRSEAARPAAGTSVPVGAPPSAQAPREYPPEVVRAFVNACVASGGTQELCSCALNRLQTRYTLDEFVALGLRIQSAGQLPSELLGEVASCLGVSVAPPGPASSASPGGSVYPPDVVQAFVDSCLAGGTTEAVCRCALGRIQSRYTLEDFVSISLQVQATGQVPEDILADSVSCALELR